MHFSLVCVLCLLVIIVLFILYIVLNLRLCLSLVLHAVQSTLDMRELLAYQQAGPFNTSI